MKEDDDRAAFNVLYSRYWKVIYQIGFKKLGDEDLAEDLVHDLFVDIWVKRAELDIHTTFVGYLHGMLTHRLIDVHRKNIFRQKVHEEIRSSQTVQDETYDSLVYSDLEQHLMAEVNNLPSSMRQIFLLSRQEELSPKEIADKLSLSVQTVKNQISSAVKRLRTKGLDD